MLPFNGDLKGQTAADLPQWCDLSLQPFGNVEKAQGDEIYVVWTGRQTGLFYDRYVCRQRTSRCTLMHSTSEDVAEAVEGQPFATYAKFSDITDARIGWYLGPVLAGGQANRITMAKWLQAQSESSCLMPRTLTSHPDEERRVKILRQEPRKIIEISDSEDSDDNDSATLESASSAQSVSPSRDDAASSTGEADPPVPVSTSYYTLCGLPLAPAGEGHPYPVIHRVHANALVAALKNRAKLVWVVVRGEAPGVYEDA